MSAGKLRRLLAITVTSVVLLYTRVRICMSTSSGKETGRFDGQRFEVETSATRRQSGLGEQLPHQCSMVAFAGVGRAPAATPEHNFSVDMHRAQAELYVDFLG